MDYSGIHFALEQLVKKLISDLYDAAKDEARRHLRELLSARKLGKIVEAIVAVRLIKRPWYSGEVVDLLEFYYPRKLQKAGNAHTVTITAIDDISVGGRSCLIRGGAGQGKSIFLRYLCARESDKLTRFPVFIQLGRYNPRTNYDDSSTRDPERNQERNFKMFLAAGLAMYSMPTDEAMFDHLARSGKLLLVLDGLDEVPFEAVTPIAEQLDSLLVKHSALQIVVGSRPNSKLEASEKFDLYELVPFDASEQEEFLRRIVRDSLLVEDMIADIAGRYRGIRTLLSTPFMLTLWQTTYRPGAIADFYAGLFDSLVGLDSVKMGRARERASDVGNLGLQRLFEAFCYTVKSERIRAPLSLRDLAKPVETASRDAKVPCSPEAFVRDFSGVLGLMQRVRTDSLREEYEFIHENIVEYYAASYIKDAKPDVKAGFYEALRSDSRQKWRSTLPFLELVDRHAYYDLYFAPCVRETLAAYGVPAAVAGERPQVLDSVLQGRLNFYAVNVRPRSQVASALLVFPGPSVVIKWDSESREHVELRDMVMELGDFLRASLVDADLKNPIRGRLGDVLADLALLSSAKTIVDRALARLAAELASRLYKLRSLH